MPFKLRGALKDIEIALAIITTLAFYLVPVTVVQQRATRMKIKKKKKHGQKGQMTITFTPFYRLPEQPTSQIIQVFIFEKMLVKMGYRISSIVKENRLSIFPCKQN